MNICLATLRSYDGAVSVRSHCQNLDIQHLACLQHPGVWDHHLGSSQGFPTKWMGGNQIHLTVGKVITLGVTRLTTTSLSNGSSSPNCTWRAICNCQVRIGSSLSATRLSLSDISSQHIDSCRWLSISVLIEKHFLRPLTVFAVCLEMLSFEPEIFMPGQKNQAS